MTEDDLTADLPAMLTTVEAAKVLRLSQRGLCNMIADGKVAGVKVGRRWLISKEEVLRVLKQGTRGYYVKAPPVGSVEIATGRVSLDGVHPVGDPPPGDRSAGASSRSAKVPRIIG